MYGIIESMKPPVPQHITPAQRRILLHLLSAEGVGRVPSYREIARALGWRSAGTVDGHVRALEEQGWLERARGQARGLRLTPAGREKVERDPGGSRSTPRIPNLSDFERRSLKPLLSFLTRRRFRPRQLLWREGDRDGFLTIVEQGHLRAYREDPSAKKIPLLLFAPGDIIGFLPLLDGGPYPASVAAVDEVVAWVLHRPALVRAVRLQPGIALSLIGLLGRRLRGSFDRIEELSMQGALPRVASTLVTLLPHPASPEGLMVIEYPESGRALAAAMGITAETLSRAITRLEADRIVHRMGRRRLQVLDVEGLKRAARPMGW